MKIAESKAKNGDFEANGGGRTRYIGAKLPVLRIPYDIFRHSFLYFRRQTRQDFSAFLALNIIKHPTRRLPLHVWPRAARLNRFARKIQRQQKKKQDYIKIKLAKVVPVVVQLKVGPENWFSMGGWAWYEFRRSQKSISNSLTEPAYNKRAKTAFIKEM